MVVKKAINTNHLIGEHFAIFNNNIFILIELFDDCNVLK